MSHDEWLTMWGECAESVMAKQEFPYWLSAYMGFMFDATDTSGECNNSLSLSLCSRRFMFP